MKYIELTQGKRAKVDDADFDFLNQWKWCLFKAREDSYAYRKHNKKSLLMHRLIVAAFVYNQMARVWFGEFAKLNKIPT